MSAQEFLRRVEQTGVVSEPLLEELRKRVSDTHKNMRPEILAKVLVDRGELTAAQARKLVAQSKTPPSETNDDSKAEADRQPPPQPTSPVYEEELTLAPDDDDDLSLAGTDAAIPLSSGASDELELVDDELVEPSRELELAQEDEGPPEAILIDDSADDLLEPDTLTPPVPVPATPAGAPPPIPPADANSGSALGDLLADPVIQSGSEGARLSPRKRGLAGLMQQLFGRGRPRKNRWDSPLILLGGGALILLLTAGVAFFALFYSENAEELFQAGDDAYAQQSYALAVKNFERFDQRFNTHPKASLARTRIELSKLRQITEGTKNWENALTFAQSQLPTVKTEESFNDVRPELSKLLPDITQGLVDQSTASESTDEKQRLLDLATKSMELVNNPEYLPTSVRKTQDIRIEEIQSQLDIVRRDIGRDRELTSATAAIAAAADSGNITEAYQLRDTLVTNYPILSEHPQLMDALTALSKKEGDAVQVGESDRVPATQDHPPAAQASIVLSDQRGQPISGVDGHVLPVLVRGAAYGLDAASGRVLWRRFVGFDTEVFPQPVAPTVGADFLLVDARRSELVRVQATTGRLMWRLPCESPIATPRVVGQRAYVCTGREADSALLAVDLATGKVAARAKFPVGCVTTPAAFPARMEIIQVGTHSSVYVLNMDTLKCTSVIPLGHGSESVTVGPVIVGNALAIVENNGHNAAKLHSFVAGAEGGWVASNEVISLIGQVTTPPAIDERRALISTDQGEVRVLEAAVDDTGLREVAATSAGGGGVQARTFMLLDRSNVWVAGNSFARLELQATRGQLVPKWVRDRDDRFLNPMQRKGNHLFHIRRRSGMLGATVSATEVSRDVTDGNPVWQTDLGVASNIAVDGSGSVHAITANGALFPINGEAVKAGLTSRRAARIDERLLPKAFSQELKLSKDNVIYASPPPLQRIAVADLANDTLKLIPLRIDAADIVTTELVEFGGSLLAACESGPVHLLDAAGKPRTNPFMPRLEPGVQIDWLRPAPISTKQFLAGESNGRLYRVASNGKTLAMAAGENHDVTFIAGIAAVGKAAYAVMENGGQHEVVSINPASLALGSQTPLVDGLAWGPQTVGSLAVVADGSGTVYAFDGNGNLKWSIDSIGPLAGAPLAKGTQLIFASNKGTLHVVNADGSVAGQRKIGEPLGGSPVAFNGRLLITGWDGTLYLVSVPK